MKNSRRQEASPRRAEDSRHTPKRAKQQASAPSSSPLTARRVGGGYEIVLAGSNNADAAAADAAASAGRLLQGLEGPLSAEDLLIIKHILKTAEAAAVADAQGGQSSGISSCSITLSKLLQAYEDVLPQHGLFPAEDVYYYRILLKLTLDPNHDWWRRFHKERKLWTRQQQTATAKAGSAKRSSPAAGRTSTAATKWHSATSSKARSRRPPAAGGRAASKTAAAGAAPAAVRAAAVAVDAATAAVAAAWADARARSSSRTAAAGVPPQRADVQADMSPEALHESVSTGSWPLGGVNGEPSACCTWLTGHDTVLSAAAAAAVNAAAVSGSQPPCGAAADAHLSGLHPAGGGFADNIQHSSTCWHSTPGALRPRAASAASLRSSCCDEMLLHHQQCQQQQHQHGSPAKASTAAPVRLRSRSLSPCAGVQRSSSSYQLLPSDITGRPSSSSSGVIHEYPCTGCSGSAGVCTCACDAVARVQPVVSLRTQAARSCSPPGGDGLSAAVLAAGQRDRLWKCLELHSSAAAKATLQQQQHQQQQQRVAAAASAHSQLREELSATQLSERQLQRHSTFVGYMGVQHNWRARALAAQTSRDPSAAADQLWMLALSFWEVHTAWRCLAWWQRQAAAAAEASNRHRRHWLLLCSFQWWSRMTQHYRRQQQPAGEQRSGSNSRNHQQDHHQQPEAFSRPASPLAGLVRVLKQHPSLRPPCSPAGEMRQQTCGRVLATYAFAAWLGVAQHKAQQKQLQEHLTWHHVQHLQATVWNKWRQEFEQANPQHRLMRAVYKARRHSTLSKAIKRWRVWAPLKHARRRRVRDAVIALHSSKCRRVWAHLRDYTAKRRVKGAAKKRAQQHFRHTCLVKCLAHWLHGLDIAAAFEELADTCWNRLLQRHAQAMLVWWRQWVVHKQQRQELLESSCCHMEGYTAHRLLEAWQGQVLRRQQLQDLLQQGLAMSERLAAKAAFRGWQQRTRRRQRNAAIVEAVSTSSRHRRITAAWLGWLDYVRRRQQQQQDLMELTQRNQHLVWRKSLLAWQGLLRLRIRLVQAVATLQINASRRCLLHWKAWVDNKADWRAFQARATQRVSLVRAASVLRLWQAAAYQQAMLRELLAGFLQRRLLRTQQRAFDWWRSYLLARVAKRMNELSALLQWEQGITRRALRVWVGRTALWRFKRQQRLRADSYRALRLLDLAMTSWSSVWAESQELAQKAAFWRAGKQAELQLLVMRAWGPEAARLRLKRERLDIARLHFVVARQQQVVSAWHEDTTRRRRLQQLMAAAVQRWGNLSLSRAFVQWRDWALHSASLHRRMRAVISMLMGRTPHWTFAMMREHALRKRHSRSARHHWQRKIAAAALEAWRQLALDAASFRSVLVDVGQRMQAGLLSETLQGWRDVVRAKHWKEANMMRALMLWGGNRRHLCFQAWRQWVQLKQGKKASVRQALKHWQHAYMERAFGFWRYHTERKQVARRVLQHFRIRYLTAALDAWRRWFQRKSYLAAVFAQLQGKGNHQVMWVVWNAWRSFVPQAQVKRHAKGRAADHWQRRALILSFAWWHEYTSIRRAQQAQLAAALLRWDTRSLWVALEGWRAVTSHKQLRQRRLVQGHARRHQLLLSTAFRGWREETQLQLYRHHVVVVLSHKVNGGMLFKAFNSWRDVVDAKQALRQQLATALTSWWLTTQRKAFAAWREATHEAIVSRQVVARWRKRTLDNCFTQWREYVLVRQQYSIITRVVTNKRVNKLLLDAWTAWREVVDQRRQVAARLRAVAQGWSYDQLWGAFDTWRQRVLRKNLGRMAVQRWAATQRARCFVAWKLWAQRERWAAGRVSTFRNGAARKLASSVLREWAAVSWLLPRQERASAFAAFWLQRRGLRGWRQWLAQRHKWHQLGDSLAARWTNLHLTAAWQGWRTWVQGRQRKAQMTSTVAKRWNNLHLAAAFQSWVGLVQVKHRHKAAVQTVAGRWRNLHTAAAFGAWCSFVAQQKQHAAAAAAVASRWQNLHLTTAFGCWRQLVAESAERAAAADGLRLRAVVALLSDAFAEWRQVAVRKARLRRQESEVSGRQQRLYKELAYGGWREAVQWAASKRAADAHWRQVVQRSLLALWSQRTQKKAGYQKTAAVVRGRTHQQLLRRSMTSWCQFTKHKQQKATADSYVIVRLQQRVFLCWSQEAGHARSKAHAAVDFAARFQARVHNQLLLESFVAWRERVQKAAAFKAVVFGFSTRRLPTYLLSWQQQANMLAGAARLLRRLLAVTVRGAFQEWRTVAQEGAHWHRVETHLLDYLRADESGAAHRATRAVLHWQNLPLAAAFSTWQQAVRQQLQDNTNEAKACKFLQLALVLKALTGFKWAVQGAHVDRAAARHRGGATKRAVLRGWRQVAWYLQEKEQKQVAASYAWSTKTKHKVLTALLSYSRFRRTRAQQTVAARFHYKTARKARVMAAWRGLSHYLAPIRRALHVMTSRRHHRSLRQLFASWQLVCHRSGLLRIAQSRLARRTLAAAFSSWRDVVQVKLRRISLLHSAVSRISHLLLARAFTRWVEAAQELKTLRAKAQQVLRNTLQRRMRGALTVWQGYVCYCEAKRAMMVVAEQQWRAAYIRRSMTGWQAFIKEARQFAALSEQMLQRRQQKQRGQMLHWWHLLAQDMHHHRAVLESFRARHIRQEGVAIFAFWKDWAHWRGLERRAIVAHWHKLMLLAFATWKQHHEDLLLERAVTHDTKRHSARTLTAWKLGMALIHRKRSLHAAAQALIRRHRLQHSLGAWMRHTYYKHMGHVALHFRVRRLACVVLREWQQAAQLLAEERRTAELLTHQLAVNCATRVLTGWQAVLRAQAHWRRRTLQGCWQYWVYWAPTHRARNAGWRAAAEELAARKLARCFYCWRWYCQVRLLREVAFQNKQRAVREALAVGEQVARRRRAALLASSFMAWRVQVSKYRQVSQKLAGLLHRNLATCFSSWRGATDAARVNMLRAQRQHTTSTLSKLLPAWQDAAAEEREEREAAEGAADKFCRKQLLCKTYAGWVEQMQVVQAQRQGLWKLMLMLLGHERRQLLQTATQQWMDWVQHRVALRACVAVFVNKRRLACLSEFLTLWQQYTAAMRGAQADEAAAATVLLNALTPPVRPRSPHASMSAPPVAAGYHTWPVVAAAATASRPGSPPGVLPVTAGPASAMLGPRSAHQDRRLARRWAAMAGGAAAGVDAGSDDEQALLSDLPPTEAAAAAADRAARQQPLLALSRGYTGRRVTQGDDREQYDDAAEAAAGGVPSPRWDLHSVAESMQQAYTLGLSPWQLPSVRTSPPPKSPHPDSLTLEQLGQYQQQYPYSLQQQWQQQHAQQLQMQHERQQLLQASSQQPIGRPSSEGIGRDYQPLLQQQLHLQEELRQQQRDEPLPWQQQQQQQGRGSSPSVGRQLPVAAEPWHTGKPRWQSPAAAIAAAGIHWADRRPASRGAGGGLIPADNNTSSNSSGGERTYGGSSSRSSSPSTASAVAGSTAEAHGGMRHHQQQHSPVNLRKCHDWAAKAVRPVSPAAAAAAGGSPQRHGGGPEAGRNSSSSSGRQQALPSYNGQVLPRELAALVSRHTF